VSREIGGIIIIIVVVVVSIAKFMTFIQMRKTLLLPYYRRNITTLQPSVRKAKLKPIRCQKSRWLLYTKYIARFYM
jgi:hypothetical protein